MTDLKALISTFTPEEEREFISFLDQKNRRTDAKNIQLFKLLQNDEISQDEICTNIYGTLKRGAYHALRKRLYSSILDFTAQRRLEEENSIDMQLIKQIVAARSFLLQNEIEIGYKILDKAETLAKQHSLFSILNEIFHTKIQYAHSNSRINIDQLVNQFELNQKNHQQEDILNIVYAKVRRKLNESVYNKEAINISKYLDTVLSENDIAIDENLSFKSLYQLIKLESISAFAKNDYLQSETFLLQSYEAVKNQPKRENQLVYHIQIIYLIANTLFRNKKFEESLMWLEKMNGLMLENKSKHYKTFQLKYFLLKALNLNYSGKNEAAIGVIESNEIDTHKDLEAVLDLKLSLVVFYFQNEEFKKAFQVLSKFYHTDKWYIERVGMDWLLKKNLVEILLHIELQHIDLVESRLKSFKRAHFTYLKKIGQSRAIKFVEFVEIYYKNPAEVRSEKFKQKLEKSFVWVEAKREDIFVMSFYAWLKSKMDNAPIYTTTMKLVQKAQDVN